VKCDPGQDYYGGSCQTHIETLVDCGAPPPGKYNAFSCNAGCYLKNVPVPSQPPTCPGGIEFGGNCLIKLDVLDDNVDVDSVLNPAFKIWDGANLSEIVHLNTAGCADDQVAISDASELTGWKCATQAAALWSQNASDIYYDTGNVGIGTSAPGYTLEVVGSTNLGGGSDGLQVSATGVISNGNMNPVQIDDFQGLDVTREIENSRTQVTDEPTCDSMGGYHTLGTCYLPVKISGGLDVAGVGGIHNTNLNNGVLIKDPDTNLNNGVLIKDPDGLDVRHGIGNYEAGAYPLQFTDDSGIEVADYLGNVGLTVSATNGNIESDVAFIGIGGHGASYAHFSHKNFQGAGQYALLQSTGGNTYLNSVGTGNLYFRNDNGTKMFIADTGEVGIGTTAPVGKLKAVSGAYYAELVYPSIFGVLGVVAEGEFIGGSFTNTSADSYLLASSGGTGVVGVGDDMGGHFLDDDSSGITDVAVGHYGIDARGNTLGGRFEDLTSGKYAYIGYGSYSLYGNGKIYTSQMLGVGTLPSYKLHVYQSSCGAFCLIGRFQGTSTVDMYGDGWIWANGGGAKPGGGSWSSISDARMKDIIGGYDKGLDEILALEPIQYRYKAVNIKNYDPSIEYVGLVAQDVQPVFPEAVSEDSVGYLQLDTNAIDYAVINAIQELKAEKDAEIAELKSIVCELKSDAEICNQ
jgi:hypothetical protein